MTNAPGDRASRWTRIQRCIATCDKCIRVQPDVVAEPLAKGEIPDPPEQIDVLFIGVAPPPLKGRSKGRHFWTNPTDPIRIGLFGQLDALLGLELRRTNERGKSDADDASRKHHFFFVHSCKVRPVPAGLKAPPENVIGLCAREHLTAEIVALGPRAVCFLGHNTSPAAALLGPHRE